MDDDPGATGPIPVVLTRMDRYATRPIPIIFTLPASETTSSSPREAQECSTAEVEDEEAKPRAEHFSPISLIVSLIYRLTNLLRNLISERSPRLPYELDFARSVDELEARARRDSWMYTVLVVGLGVVAVLIVWAVVALTYSPQSSCPPQLLPHQQSICTSQP